MNIKQSHSFFRLTSGLALIAFLTFSQTVSPAMATMQSFSQSASVVPTNPTLGEPPQISSGALAGGQQSAAGVQLGPTTGVMNNDLVPSPDTTVGTSFEGFGFDDNATENAGFVFIPPDPIGAAGTDRLLAVVNTMIEIRNKSGVLQWRDSLKDFFSPLGAATLGTNTFDPKVVFDQYENRFVVVTLERTDTASGGASNESRILLAVSKTATPATATAADWYYMAINSKTTISAVSTWADYPGFEVDEEAIYVTNSMFSFGGAPTFQGVRLWIIPKGVASGFYGGGPGTFTIHNPYASAGVATTTMPAQIMGVGGAGGTIGTYLVSYSGLSSGGIESVQVVRVDNPLGAIVFTQEFVTVGDIENTAGAFPDAPQMGTATLIETNDRRALDAVWRNNQLWLVATILPAAGADAGQTTAHWWKLSTSAVPGGAITLGDQGNIGGNDIAANTFTFFPSLAVNSAGDVCFGFAASASAIFGGAYVAARAAGDAAGTVQNSVAVKAGEDYYVRTFGGPRNRWGDYSGMSLDPADDSSFWAFNEFADTRGTIISGEDGRWGTAWGKCQVGSTSPTNTPTNTPTSTHTAIHTSTSTATQTPTNTATRTFTPTATATSTAGPSPTPTATATPTSTNTPGGSDVIFADGFESGNLSAWTSSTTDLGDLSVSAAAALVGTQGMQALIDDNNVIYVTSDHPNAETRYLANFRFDPNSITMVNGDTHTIFGGYMGTSTLVLRLQFRRSSNLYQLQAALLNDGSTFTTSSWFTISDAPHQIALDWKAATSAGANNGSLTLSIDGAQQANLTGVDNDTRRIDRARLGAVAGIDTGTRGTYYFDEFQSSRGGGGPTPTPTATPTNTPPVATVQWPMYGHDAAHTSRGGAAGPAVQHIKWTATLSSFANTNSGPIVGADGTLFVSTWDRFYVVNSDGSLRCDVALVGNAAAPAMAQDSSVVYVPDANGIRALNPANCSVSWSFSTRITYSSPTVGSDGTIYFGSSVSGQNSRLYALNPNGSTKWSWDSGSTCWIESSPALGPSGQVYFHHNCLGLIALNSNGGFLWQASGLGEAFNHPSVGADGTIYVGDSTGLYAINPNGTTKWSRPTANFMYSSSSAISQDGSLIFRGDNGGIFYAINTSNGTIAWQYNAGVGPITSAPVLATNGVIYFTRGWSSSTTTPDRLVALLATNGTQLWSFNFATSADISHPVLANDSTLHVMAREGLSNINTLYAFDGSTTVPTPTPTNTPTVTATAPTNTPTATATSNSSDLIFADGFESGNLLAWTSSTTDLGDLSASAAAALVGNQGMQAVVDDANTIYVTDDTPNTETRYRMRFYFDPNSITMATNDAHYIFKGFVGTSTEVLRVEFGKTASTYQIRAALLDDGSTWITSNWFTISDAPHPIEFDWRASTAAGANNGGLALWIDGIQKQDLTGIDNDTRRIDRGRLGALTGIDTGTSGTYYFDAFVSRRQNYIGP